METEYYVIVRHGLVQRAMMTHDISGKSFKAWPVAGTYHDARRLVRHYSDKFGRRLTCYRMGTFPGESFEGHVRLAMAEGCGACCCVRDWTPEGEPMWETMYFDPSLAGG